MKPFVAVTLVAGAARRLCFAVLMLLPVHCSFAVEQPASASSSAFGVDTRSAAIGGVVVSVTERSLVTLRYDLASVYGDASIDVAVSIDDGGTYTPLSLAELESGSDVGSSVRVGSGCTIRWQSRDRFPDSVLPNVRLRVQATRSGIMRSAISPRFAIDTRVIQNLAVDAVSIPAEVFSGTAYDVPVSLRADRLPDIPVTLRLTADSVLVKSISVAPGDWVSGSEYYTCTKVIGWHPQTVAYRVTTLVAKIDEENVIEETEETADNKLQTELHIRVREQIGSVGDYRIYADIADRGAYEAALANHGENLGLVLRPGSLEVLTSRRKVSDPRELATVLELFAKDRVLNLAPDFRYFVDFSDAPAKNLFDSSRAWEIVDPIGSIVDLLEITGSTASTRKDVLLHSVLHTSTEYGLVKLFCDLIPAILGGVSTYKSIGDLSSANESLISEFTKITVEYRYHLEIYERILSSEIKSTVVFDDDNTTIWMPMLEEVIEQVTNEWIERFNPEESVKMVSEDVLQEAIESIVKATLRDMFSRVFDYGEEQVTSLRDLLSQEASRILFGIDKLRAIRGALECVQGDSLGSRAALASQWMESCDLAIAELEQMYRQKMCIIDPSSNPDAFATMLGIGGDLLNALMPALAQNAVEEAAELALREGAIGLANLAGNHALAGSIGGYIAAPLIGLKAGQLLTNFSAMDDYRDAVLQCGAFNRDFVDELWYLTSVMNSPSSRSQSACHLLASLRYDITAYSYDQLAMFCDCAFYGLGKVIDGQVEGIARFREQAETVRGISDGVRDIANAKEKLLYSLLLCSSDFNSDTLSLDDALPSREFNSWPSMDETDHLQFPLGSLDAIGINAHVFTAGSDFTDGERRLFMRPYWACGPYRFSSFMEMSVEQFAGDGSLLASVTKPSDGGLTRSSAAEDGFFWDSWALKLNPAAERVNVFVRGRDWLFAAPLYWMHVARIDCSSGATPQSVQASAGDLTDTIRISSADVGLPTGPIVDESEGTSFIAVTNVVAVDADTNGLVEASTLLGFYTKGILPTTNYIGVEIVDHAISNSWRCLYGPFSAAGGERTDFSIEVPCVYSLTAGVARVSLLDGSLFELAQTNLDGIVLEQVVPPSASPDVLFSGYDSIYVGASSVLCRVTCSLISGASNTVGDAQVVLLAGDTNGVVGSESTVNTVGAEEPTTFLSEFELTSDPSYVRLCVVDERHVVVATRHLSGTAVSVGGIEAVQPQDAVDADADGDAEIIPVRVLLVGGAPGQQNLLLSCGDGSGSAFYSKVFSFEREPTESQWLTVQLPVAPLLFSGLVPPWQLNSVRWYASDGSPLGVYATPVPLNVPEYPELPPVRFSGSNSWAIVSDSQGAPRFLNVNTGVECDHTGGLSGRMCLSDQAGNRIGSARLTMDADATQTTQLTFSFDLSEWTEPIPDGPYLIDDIELWAEGIGNLGHFVSGFVIGDGLTGDALMTARSQLAYPVSTWLFDSDADGIDDRVGLSIGVVSQGDEMVSLQFLCAGGATNTVVFPGIRLGTNDTVIVTNVSTAALSELAQSSGEVRFLQARLFRAGSVLSELSLSNTLSLAGAYLEPATVEAIHVTDWGTETNGVSEIEVLNVSVAWNCSQDIELSVLLRLTELGSGASWSSARNVSASAGSNSTVLSYPGWLFWSANLSNALVAAHFEARDMDGRVVGVADNLSTSIVWTADAFASCPLPDMAVERIDVFPLIDQAGVGSLAERVRVRTVLRNIGDSAADGCKVEGITYATSGAVPASNESIPPLQAGQEWVLEMDLLRGYGTYSLGINVDPEGKLTERSRVNNSSGMALTLPLDSDGDTLPDLWEHAYFSSFTNATSQGDPDSDGAGNWHEQRAGTDPMDPDSVFSAEVLQQDGPRVRWISAPGRMYRVWWTDDLTSWSVDDSILVGETDEWQPVDAADRMLFFKVSIEE